MDICECGHPCHCKGKGRYINSATCNGYGSCKCVSCKHQPNIGEEMNWIKKQWQKFIDWVFKGFYK
jgi:hypothetical protein